MSSTHWSLRVIPSRNGFLKANCGLGLAKWQLPNKWSHHDFGSAEIRFSACFRSNSLIFSKFSLDELYVFCSFFKS